MTRARTHARPTAGSTATAAGGPGRLDARDPPRRYALALARQLQQDATTLLGWWSADGGDFLREIRDAGQGSATFGTEREALNALTDALFYLEKETKDMKLAIPLGLIDCTTAACPERVESAHAGASLDHVRANLLGFDALFAGTDDVPGFEALLTDLGAGELADRMRSETQRAINAIDAIEMPLSVAVVQDPGAVLAVHEAVSSVVRDLKTQFITTLDVEIPQRAEGDNDDPGERRHELRLTDALFRPVHPGSVVALRVAVGLLGAFGAARFLWKGWVDRFFVQPTFLPYWGFEAWTRSPSAAMHGVFAALVVLGLAVAIGLRTRLSAAAFLALFVYVEVIDITNYLNHYVLLSWLMLLLALLPHPAWGSLDGWLEARAGDVRGTRSTPPLWVLGLFRLQIACVYFFAGVAKLNPDWLLHGHRSTSGSARDRAAPPGRVLR